MHLSVAKVTPQLRVKYLIARRQNDRPYFYFYLLRRLMKIDGLILTDAFANSTFFLFKVKAVFMYIRDKGNRLGEVDMDGFIGR